MKKIVFYTILVLGFLFAGCAGTTDQPLSSPQDAKILLDALPDESVIDSTVALTQVGKKNLRLIKSDLQTLAGTTPGDDKDDTRHLTLSKVQKEVIRFATKRNKDDWDRSVINNDNAGSACVKQCFTSFEDGLKQCNALSGLPGATCTANNVTVYLLCLRSCASTR